MSDVASKQQTTALFLSTIATRTRRHTELTKKLTNLLGNLCCAREHSVQFFVQFVYTVYLRVYGALYTPFIGDTEGNHKPHSGQRVAGSKFEPRDPVVNLYTNLPGVELEGC